MYRFADALCDSESSCGIGLWQNHGEFFAPISGHKIARAPYVCRDCRSHRPENIVADLVTVVIVEGLEAVHIEQDERSRKPRPKRGFPLPRQGFIECPAIGK